jgi:DNA sulfur modification protein DndD
MSIKLKNIGPFYGDFTFDLETTHKQNIILIGGKNGSGKTTLLTALKLGIFGPHALGFQTVNKTYTKKVIDLLNTRSIERGITKFYVQVNFFETSDLVTKEVSITRNWHYSNMNLSEKHIVKIDGVLLDDEKTIQYLNNLKSKIHPSLLSSLMFDGEKIATILDDGKINVYLQNIIDNAFNLSLFNSFNNDLSSFISQEAKKSNLSQEEILLLQKRNELNSLKKDFTNIETELNKWETNKKDLEIKKTQLILEYKMLGGLSEIETESLKKKIHGLEVTRKENQSNLNYFLEHYYTFAINKNLLIHSKERIIDEFPHKILNLVEYYNTNVDQYSKSDEMLRIMELLKSINSPSQIHEASTTTLDKIDYILSEINNGNSIKTMKNAHRSINEKSKISSNYKSKLSTSEQKDLEKKYIEILQTNSIIENAKKNIKEKNISLQNTQQLINFKEQELMDIENLVYSKIKKQNSFKLANKIIDINNQFLKTKKEQIITDLEELISIKFNRVIRKENYIEKIKISRTSLDLALIRNTGEKFTINNLSAGEKQVLIGCIITSIYELSKKKLPFIFDTPLARLDSENRKSFIKEIILNASRQVLILSTDEEINKFNYKIVESNLNNVYLMENTGDLKTQVKQGEYFGGIKYVQ